MNYIKGGLKWIDLFGSPVEFLRNQDSKIKTVIGGLGSLVLIIIFFSVFHKNILGFFSLKFVSYTTKDSASINLRVNSTS